MGFISVRFFFWLGLASSDLYPCILQIFSFAFKTKPQNKIYPEQNSGLELQSVPIFDVERAQLSLPRDCEQIH